jgi:hypothetical protein
MAAGKAKVNFGAVPVPVQTTIRTLATPDNVKKILVEVDGGVTMFQARFTVDGADTSAMIAPSGEILEIKRTTDQSVLPRMAMEALKERYKDATLLNTASVQRFYYEVNVVVDGRVHEVRVDPSGRLHDVDRTEKDAD